MRSLLDVNVLIALLDAAHIHHALASAWLSSEKKSGWASCPLTQNGCVRVMAQAAYPGTYSIAQVVQRLAALSNVPEHRFWPAAINLLDQQRFEWSAITGHRQITDAYLLALAVKHAGRFVTFDRGVSPAAVTGADSRHICLLP